MFVENKLAIEYDKLASRDIVDICAPLFRNFNLTHFWYSRFYENGGFLELSTDPIWKEYLWTNKFSNYSYVASHGFRLRDESSLIVWPQVLSSSNSDILMAATYGIYNGANIFLKKENYIECLGFATHQYNHDILDFFKMYSKILKIFGDHFKDKAHSIINQSPQVFLGQSFLFTPPKITFEKEIQQFFKDIKKDQYTLKTLTKDIQLSKRQVEILLNLSYGKTMKEIALGLNISRRTVETHLANIKEKTGISIRSGLISCFLRSDLI